MKIFISLNLVNSSRQQIDNVQSEKRKKTRSKLFIICSVTDFGVDLGHCKQLEKTFFSFFFENSKKRDFLRFFK